MPNGDSVDNPLTANLKDAQARVTVYTETGQKLIVDMREFAKAAEKLGADAHDVMSINGYRNAKGELVPDYDSVRIVRRDADT